MKAIEFETITNKGIIKIPEKYNDFSNKKVKVILIEDEYDDLSIKEKLNTFTDFQKYMKDKNIIVKEKLDIDEIANEVNL